uniref:Uncharacterized protein n=1 Tax=Fagus sylvatica TaxID=28930 RepID=A0A2N9G8Q9_FAGSY
MAPGSRGVGAVFVHSSGAKIPIKRGMLSANREFHDVAGVIIFPTHPGSRINLLRAGKTLRAKAAVREKKCVLLPARFFSNLVPVPDSRESELGLVRYGPASRVHRGVFGPFEGSFPIRIPADPDKFLAIREFHVVHGCVLFPMCPGSQINLLRVRKTLCASVATSVGKFRNFQQNLISSACFHARGRRSSRCRISTILVSSESLRYLLFNGGGQFDSAFGLVNGPVKPWSNLVNLGQTWSDLVKKFSKLLGNVSPGFISRVSGQVGPSRVRNGLVKQLGQTLVNSGQTWSTLVKLGQTLGNVFQDLLLEEYLMWMRPSSDQAGLVQGCLVLRADTRENPGGKNGVMTGWMFTRLAFTRALTGADDHARFVLPKEVKRVLDHRGSTCTPPSISTGVKGEGWILVFHVLDIKGFVVEPVPAQPHLSPAYLGGNVCAKILSDPLQLGPRAKTLRQEVHFSYHTQLSDRQELLRSSRNLSQKMTPWHKEHSNGLRSQDHILRTQARLCARPVPLENRVFLTRNKLIYKPGHVGKKTHSCTTWNSRIAKNLPGLAGIPIGKLPSNGPKTPRWPLFAGPYLTSPSSDFPQIRNLAKVGSASFPTVPRTSKIRHRELGQICARTGTRFEKKRAGSKTRFSSRTAAFARRVFPARNKLIREPGCVGKIMTPGYDVELSVRR